VVGVITPGDRHHWVAEIARNPLGIIHHTGTRVTTQRRLVTAWAAAGNRIEIAGRPLTGIIVSIVLIFFLESLLTLGFVEGGLFAGQQHVRIAGVVLGMRGIKGIFNDGLGLVGIWGARFVPDIALHHLVKRRSGDRYEMSSWHNPDRPSERQPAPAAGAPDPAD